MIFVKRIFSIITILAVFLAFSVTPSVQATKQNGLTENEQMIIQELEKFEEINDKNDIDMLKFKFKDFSQKLDVNNDFLKYESAKAYNVKESNSKTLTVPVTDGENYHEVSNISVYFDSNGEVLHYTELYVSRSNQDTFEVELLVNGEVQGHEITNETFTTAEELHGGIGVNVDWNGFLNCMGIPGSVAGLIASICSVACAITAGLGCVACASLVLGINGGAIAACLELNW